MSYFPILFALILLLIPALTGGESRSYPEFSANMTRSGQVRTPREVDDVIYFMKLDYDADLIFARVNITKFNSGYYDCCIRIPNLFCTNGNLTAEGWTANITFRCFSILTIDYMLVFNQFNITIPPVEPPINPPINPPTEPTFNEYPLSNKVLIILLAFILFVTGGFAGIYSYIVLADRFCPKKKKKHSNPKSSTV